MRAEVDLLTLTATPIPRTLNMAMSGIRDLSIIATPPARRMAVKTLVSEWDRSVLREALLDAIEEPREEVGTYAPKIKIVKIDPEKIGLLIGPGGKNIRAIQEDTGASVDVEDDGTVYIACTNAEMAKLALSKVEACTATVQVGRIYDGRVTSIKDFGAFVEILPGKEGLLHISELAHRRVEKVEDVVVEGQQVAVKVLSIDTGGKIRLSRKATLSRGIA